MIFNKASFLNFFILFFTFLNSLNARPVSYQDSWTFMTYNNYDSHSSIVHYSPTSKYSFGYKLEYWQSKEYFLNSVNLNYLIKRINKKYSQANLYVKSGLGIMSSDFKDYEDKNELAGHVEIASDWETRRYFISYFSKVIKSESIDNTYMQHGRLGIAPYIADYGKIHTWIMYELKHMPEMNDTLSSGVILRFFKSTNMIELGIDEKKNLAFNFIKRF